MSYVVLLYTALLVAAEYWWFFTADGDALSLAWLSISFAGVAGWAFRKPLLWLVAWRISLALSIVQLVAFTAIFAWLYVPMAFSEHEAAEPVIYVALGIAAQVPLCIALYAYTFRNPSIWAARA